MTKANSLFVIWIVTMLLFVTGCDEEFPITEGILGERDNGNGDIGDAESLDDLPDILGFDGTFDGETDAATPSSDEDFQFLAEAGFVLWHMERLLQRMDTIVANVGEDESYPDDTLWDEGFQADNCGDSGDMDLDANGQDGALSFDEACLERMARTDGRSLELDGELLWENLRSNEDQSFEDDTVTSRSLFLDELSVRWRDEVYQISAINELQEDEDRLAIVMDVTHDGTGKTLRLVSTRLPGDTSNAERRIFFDDQGVLTQSNVSSNWVSATETDCDNDVGAGGGNMTLAAGEDDDSNAQLRMEFVLCDNYELTQLQDSDGDAPSSGDLFNNELFEVLW